MRFTFNMEGAPFLVLVAIGICMIVFVVSFFAAFSLTLYITSRPGDPVHRAEDRKLSWSERAARNTNFLNRFLLADEFRLLRRLYFAAWAGAFGSFALILLLTLVFGKRV